MALVLGVAPGLALQRCGVIVMAVPKKRTSRSKRKIRHNVWRDKARKAADKALSLAKSVLTGRSNSFYYETDEPTPPSKCCAQEYALTEEGMGEEEMRFQPPVGNVKPGMVAALQQGIAALMALAFAFLMKKLPRVGHGRLHYPK